MRRKWKTHDLVGLFSDHIKGRLPFQIPSNYDMESWGDFYSVKLDPGWPYGIPDANPMEDEERVDNKFNRKSIMKFNIETDIPLPSIQRMTCGQFRADMLEALTALQPSQSFFVPLRGPEDKIGTLQGHLTQVKVKLPGRMFTSRKEVDAEQKPTGIRIWRVT